jgi:bacteriocin-like protein
MTNKPKSDSRNDVAVLELTEDQLKQVSGGVRDAVSGLASGKRMHKPFSVLQN